MLTKNEMTQLIDSTTHMHRDEIHTSLVHRNTRTTVVTLIIAAVFLVGLMVSCEDPELAPSVPSTLTRQHLTLQGITPRTIEPHASFSALNTNQAEEKHTYDVYRLPSTGAGTLELTLTLKDPDYKESNLKDKTFLLVTSNTSTIERSFSAILPPLKHVTGTAPNPDDVQFSKSPSPYYSRTAATKFVAKEAPDYGDYHDRRPTDPEPASERTFQFRKNAGDNIGYDTTLYVKKEATIEGRTIRMLFWVEESKRKGIIPLNAYNILNKLADEFLDVDGIYQDMYAINGGHVWDYADDDFLTHNAAPKDPTEIHIGIGKIPEGPKDKKDFFGGFVTPYVAFKDISKLFLSGTIAEEYYAPTVYLNIEYLNSIGKAPIGISKERGGKFDMYSTLTHELQHIAAHSSRRLQTPQYSNGRLVVYSESQWFNELFAVSIEHILGHKLVQAVGSADPTGDLFTWRGGGYYSRLIKNEIITQYGLTPPDDYNGLDASVYELYRVFSMYLFNNYGIDVLRNVMFDSDSDKKDSSAIFEAIKNTTLYDNSDEKTRPDNFSEVVNDFYVSILLSDTAYQGDGNPTSTLTFFAPQDTPSIQSDKGIAQYGLTTLPDNGSPSPYKALTFNLINAIAATAIATRKETLPHNRSGIMPTEDLWTKGHGPLIDTPKTAQNTVRLSNSQGRFIYLGGKLSDGKKRVRNLAFTVTKDAYLQLKLTMTPGVVSSLVVVTETPTP